MRMVLVGSPCKARRRHLLSPSVTEQKNNITKIIKNVLVHAKRVCNFHSQANRSITVLTYYFKDRLPYSWEKRHEIFIHTQINLGEAKVK